MIVFVSMFVSPHTLPLGVALTQYDQVCFVNTAPLTDERKRMGYQVTDKRVSIYQYDDSPEKCQQLIDTADTVIFSAPFFHLLTTRLNQNKRTFLFHERIFKKGVLKWLDPRTYKLVRFCKYSRHKELYLLCAGENAAKDFKLLGFSAHKIFRFGYFPEIAPWGNKRLQKKTGEICNILWVGRMVGFKRPLMAVKALKGLESEFKLTMVGDGKLLSRVKQYAIRHNINILFTGNLDHKAVREKMYAADILLSTSNKGEGWGVVINEGMNCGCAIVCSDEIGCIHTLVNKKNAEIFQNNSIKSLRGKLLNARNGLTRLSKASIDTIKNSFNPDLAAERFISLCNKLPGKTIDFEDGLCSHVYHLQE